MNFMSSDKDLVAAQTVAHPDSSQPDVVKIADENLLFGGTFHRAGSDLHLSGADGEHVIVPGYFASETPLTLVAPNGGRLTHDVVALLANRFAELQPTATSSDANHHAGPDAIGHVQNVVGDVTVMRNGVVVGLHLGDAVYKSDIVQTGGASSVGISFSDGTAVNLVANTQMALSEYSYHANSDANSALFSLIEGTFAFVIGKVADAGNMKIVTPVATLGVHDGSTGWAHKLTASEITAISTKLGHVTYSFAVVHKHAGQADDVYDLVVGGKVIGSIADPHMVSYLDQDGNLISLPLDSSAEFPDLLQWLQNNDPTTSAFGVHGSGNATDASSFPPAVNLNQSGRSFDFNPNGGGPFDFSSHNGNTNSPKPASNIFIWNGIGNWDRQLFNWNQGFAPDSSIDVVFIQTGKSTFNIGSTIANLTVDSGATLNITGGSLTTSGLTNAGLIALNSSGVDPALVFNGAVKLTGGGTIEMLGPTTGNFIYGLGAAELTNIDNLIAGSGNIGIDDGHLTFINKATVDATPINAADSGLLVIDTGNAVTNFGLFEATLSGKLLIEDQLINSGRVEAIGAGSSVVIDNKASVNIGLIEAIGGGAVTIKDSTIVNSGGGIDGLIEAGAGSEILLENATVLQGLFTVDAGGQLETVTGTVNRIDTTNGTRNTTTPSLVNNGTVVVNDDSSLTLASPFDIENAGTIELLSTGDKTLLLFNQPFAILSGGGNIILEGGNGSQDIIGGQAGPGFTTTSLENRDNIISGAGAIGQGDDALTFKNDSAGTVDANLSGQTLLIDLGTNTAVNAGLFEATDRATLEIASDLDNLGEVIARSRGHVLIEADVTNESGGKIVARKKGATVEFRGAAGDRIDIDNSGDIAAERGGTVSFEHTDITNERADKPDPAGRIVADGKGSKVEIQHSSVDNDGVIVAKDKGKVEFRHDRVDNEIDGLIIAKGDNSEISFDRSRVKNSGEIKAELQGQIRFDHSRIVNERDGSIDADGKGSRVTFEHDRVDNFGEMSATLGGSLRLDESWIRNQRSGTIEADGSGSKVEFDRDHVKNSGRIEAENHGEVKFDKSHIDNISHGTIEADGRGSEVEFDRSHVENSGRIEAEHHGEVSFTKSHVDNISHGTIKADGRGSEVAFDRSHIDNSGRIEAEHRGEVTFTRSDVDNERHGTIEADGRGSEVEFDRSDVDNSGRIEAEHQGEVKFYKSHIDNHTHGTIEADGKGSRVEFKRDRVDNSGEIDAVLGGFVLFDESRIRNERGGEIEADGRGSEVKFDRDYVDNSGRIEAEHRGEVRFSESDVDNDRHGTIEADGRGSEVTFDRSHVDNSGRIESEHDGEVTFSRSHVDNDSHGTIEADGRGSRVEFKRDRVDNSGDITAAAGGFVLFEESRIRNERWGTIEADGRGSEVKFDRDHVENSGSIEAVHSGEVKFYKSHVDNERGGTIEADGRGSEVKFDRSHVDNSGRIEADHSAEVTFDKSHVDNSSHGTIEADGRDSEVTFDRDHVDNSGGIEAEHGGEVAFTRSHVDNNSHGEIEAKGRGSELKFERDRINNWGEISATWGGFALFEESRITNAHGGTIEADGSGSEVKFDRDHVDNSGRIEADHGGEVKFTKSHIEGDGTIEADGKGSQVKFDRDRVDNNGTIQALLNGAVHFYHTHVDNKGGLISATGLGSTVDFDSTYVTGGDLTSVSGGLIVALGGISTLKDLTITLGSEVDVDTTLKLTGTIHNFGTISVSLSGLLELVWSTLDGGLVSNHHTVQVYGSDTMEGGLTVAGGDLVMETGSTLHIEDTVQFDGVHVDNSVGAIIVDLVGPAKLVLEDGTAIDGGSLTVNGFGTLDVEHGANPAGPHGAVLDGVTVTNSGAIDIGAATAAVLILDDGTSVSGAGTFTIESGSTLDIEPGTGLGAHGATLDGIAVTDAGSFDVGDVAATVLTLEDGTNIMGAGGALTVKSGSTVDVEKGDGTGPDFGAVFSGLTVVDQGTIDVGDTQSGTTLVVGGGTSIDGGGTGKLKVNSGSKIDTEKTASLNGVVVTDNGDFDVGDAIATTLTLGGGTVIGGTGALTVKSGSKIDVESGTGPGGTGARLDGLAVTDRGAIAIGTSGTSAILTLDDGTAISGIAGSLQIKSGSTLDVEQGAGLGAHGATLDGIVVTTGTSADSIAVGQTSTAALALKNGTSVTGGRLTIGAAGGIGSVDVEGVAGATLDGVAVTAYAVTDAIEIAQTDASTLLLDDGTSIKGGSLVIGASGHTGTVDVETADGATFDGVAVTAFATDDIIEVGQTSASTLLLENGTSITGGSLALGAAGHVGTVDVETASGATFDGVTVTAHDATDIVEVGQTTTSKLLLTDGTSVTGGSLILGTAGGTVDVESAAGATLDGVAVTANAIADSIEVGQTGPSTLLLKNGTSVAGTTIVIGATGNTATVDVESAAGATLDNVIVTNFAAADGIEVGQTGPSTLLLKDGTRILGGSLDIGAAGHIGTVDVETTDGATFDGVTVTAFATADIIEVGQTSSNAMLLLKDGASIASGTLVLGAAGGSGKLDVESAAGATVDGVAVQAFNASNIVEVAHTGTSTLLLKDGTSIANATLLVGAAGSVGTVDVESTTGATFDAVTITAAGILNTIEVGQTGNSALLLTHGTSMKGGTLALGSAAGTGTVDFEGTSLETLDGVAVTSYLTKGTVEVGQTGATTLLINDGTSITNGSLKIGASGHTAIVDVESANGAIFDGVTVTAYDATDTIEVGQTGTSKLLLKDGTSLSNGTLALGVGGAGAGTVNVESVSGAALHGVTVTAHDSADGIEIGKAGASTLTMDGGTTMTGGTLTIDTGSTLQIDPSLAILSGVNLVNHGNIIVDPGTAQLTLKSGTTVTGGTIHVGAEGTLEIDNSTLTNVSISNAGIVDIGTGDTFTGTDTLTFVGAAELDIEAGAQVNLALAGIDTNDTIDLKGLVVSNAVWDGSHLFLNGNQVGFSISGGLPTGDTFAFKTDGNGGTDLKVATQLVHVTGGTPGAGTEGSPIAIGFTTGIDPSASLTTYLISGIPAGAILSDGHNSFTANATLSQVDIHLWNLATLTITPPNDTNFQLSAIVTATDAQGYSYSATGTESVTVSPLPPVVSFGSANVTGATGQSAAIGLNVAVGAETGPNGDGSHNSISSVVISSIPNGATLTDGSGGHHATVTGGSLDVTGWNYSGLTFTPTTSGSFSLTATVTEHDSDGQSSTHSATEHVAAVTRPTISSNDSLGSNVLRPVDTISAFESGNPTNVTYQWFSSVDGYSHAIGSGQNYVVQLSDIGNSIEAVATFTAPDGTTATAASTPLGNVIQPLVFTIGSQTDLTNAINNVSVGGIYQNTAFIEFNFTQGFTLNSNLAGLNLLNSASLIINGNGATIDGAGAYRGLFVFSGNVAIDNLNINNTVAQGGGGIGGSGGGAGLGGGLFVASGGIVAINNVNFSGDVAIGGRGGQGGTYGNTGMAGGGGGGMGVGGHSSLVAGYRTDFAKEFIHYGNHYVSTSRPFYRAYIQHGAAGGTLGVTVPGRSVYQNVALGSAPTETGFATRGFHLVVHAYVGNEDFGTPASFYARNPAQNGLFGGGGGGGLYGKAYYTSFHPQTTGGGNGGFGGGGGAAGLGVQNSGGATGGAGGFGGGGGRSAHGQTGGAGGFGAGNGGSGYGGGGGGLGAGGGIFVQSGGSLTVSGGSFSGNNAFGGPAGSDPDRYQGNDNVFGGGGSGLGAGIFLQGNENLKLAPLAGNSLTVASGIADQSGSGGTGNVEIGGNGVVHFAAVNTYSGTTVIDSGATLDVDSGGTVGAGAVTVTGTLNLNGGGNFFSALTVSGTLNVNAGTNFSQNIQDNGALNLNALALFSGGVSGNGNVALNANGIVTFGSVSGSGTFTFGSGVAATAVVTSGTISKTIKGFTYGDIIDLRGIAAVSDSLGASNVLTLKKSDGTSLGTLNFDPAQTGLQIGLLSDGAGGTRLAAIHTSFSVGTAADFAAALAAINQGGADYSLGTAYTITFTGNITLSSQLPFFTLGSGSSLLIDGAGYSFNGGTVPYGILDNSAIAAIRDLSISDPNVSIYIAGANTDTLTLSQTSGHSMTISGAIVDEGHGAVVIGGGTVTFTSANTYSGGTTIAAGATLNLAGGGIRSVVDNGNISLGSATAGIGGAVTGSGAITFQPNINTVLTVTSGVPTTTFYGMADGDVIDLAGIAATGIISLGGNNYALTSSDGTRLPGTLHFDPLLNLSSDPLVIFSDGAGGTDVRLNNMPVFTAGSAEQLATIINQIHVGGVYSQTNTNYEIDLTGSFALTGNLPEIRLASGDSLSIVGHGFTISGASNGNPAFTAFLQQAGSLSISDLTISQTGGNGSALNMGANVSASLSNVTFVGNQAPGGLGGAIAVAAGSILTFSDGSLSGNTAVAGAAFWLNGGTVNFTQTAGHTITVANSIGGPGGTINISGAGDFFLSGGFDSGNETIDISGTGNVTLSGAFLGSQTVTTHPGSGTLTVLPVYAVGSANDLAAAVNAINTDPIGLLGGINYVINLTADVPATAGLPTIHLDVGDTLTINTNGHLLEGASNATFTYAATGPGNSTVLTGGALPTFSVATADDLAHTITAVDGGLFANASYVVNLTADVSVTSALSPFTLTSGATLTIHTHGHLFDGATNGAGGDFTFTATGGSTALAANTQPIVAVGTSSDLASAFQAISTGGLFAATNTNYVINLTDDIVLTNPPHLTLGADDKLTIHANGHLIDGASPPDLVFTSTGPGGSTVLQGSTQPTIFEVSSAADLVAALQAIGLGGFLTHPDTNYIIDLNGDITLTGNLPSIALGAGDTLTIHGGTHVIDGGGIYSGLYLQSGNLVLSDLKILHTVEIGGDGGLAGRGGGGGGGLGAGGGLFVASGASATLDNVVVTQSSAIGGAGGAGRGSRGGGGGGGALDSRSPYSFGLGGNGGGYSFSAGSAFVGGAGGFGAGGGGTGGYGGHSYFSGGAAGYGAGNGGGTSFFGYGGGGGGAGLGGGIFVAAGGSLTFKGGTVSGNSAVGGQGGAGRGYFGGFGSDGGSGLLGLGTGLFTDSQSVTLAPDPGKTLTISDTIAGGGIGVINIAGPGDVVLSGAITGTTINISGNGSVTLPTGTLVNDSFAVSGSANYTLTNDISGGGTIKASGSAMLIIASTNSLTGGMVLDGTSTIELNSAQAGGNGPITFADNANATLIVEPGDTPSSQVNGFYNGDTIKLVGFAANASATLGAGNILTVTDGTNSAQIHLTPGFDYSSTQFIVASYSGATPSEDGVAISDAIGLVDMVVGQPQNGNQVTFNGVGGLPGGVIHVLIDGVEVGTATPNSVGHFSFTTSALGDGKHAFTTTETGVGNQSTSFTVDVLPTAPTLALASGEIPVNNTGIQFVGTGEAGQIITLKLVDSSNGVTTYVDPATDANGNYSFVLPSNLADGHYTATATETDADGVVSNPSATLSFNVVPPPPTVTGVSGLAIDGAASHITGTTDPGRTVNIYNGGAFIGGGVANSHGNFDVTVVLSHGVYSLTATSTDVIQSTNFASQATAFTINVEPQAPTITTLVGQPVNGGTVQITGHTNGTSVPNGVITFYEGSIVVGTGTVTGASFTAITSTSFADGVHSLTATVTDSDNLTSPLSGVFNVNVLPDKPVISSVTATGPQVIDVQGTGEAGYIFKIFADGSTLLGQGTVGQDGTFDIGVATFGGHHTITVTETEPAGTAGLTSQVSAGVVVEVTPNAPTITSVSPSVGTQVDASHGIVVKGTGQHVGETITIYADGGTTAIGSGTVAGDGSFTIVTAPLGDGQHTLTATDTANSDVSAPSGGFVTYVDPAPVTNLSQVGGVANHGILELQGSGQVGDTVTLMLDNTVIGHGFVDSTGHFDVQSEAVYGSLLVGGLQTVTVMQTDATGHTSPASSFVAQVPPAVPGIDSVVSVPDVLGRAEVKGTGDAGTIIKLYDGTTVIGTGTVDSNGHYDIYTQPIGSGTHSITATESTQGIESPASAAANVVVATVANTWTITSVDDLAKAIAAIDVSGSSAQAGAHYTFNFAGDVTLNDQLPAFNLPQGASLVINGNHHTLDANGKPGLFVYAGGVEIDDLSVVNAVTRGGTSIFYGGGGAGLGGGLFIASAGHVTLSDVNFANNNAVGGGSTYSFYFIQQFGGGGGLNGGAGGFTGGGGIGVHANGAGNHYLYQGHTPGGTGIVLGAAAGGSRTGDINSPVYLGGANGGGGGQGPGFYTTSSGYWGVVGYGRPGSGGGIGGAAGTATVGGAGGFGGGGAGGGWIYPGPGSGGAGGFGGGGGAGGPSGGTGGFGGGGGGSSYNNPGNGGFGGGNGNGSYGGGGLGAGGAIFVQQGGSLTFAGSGSEQNDGVGGGFADYSNVGSAYGSGVFLQGDESITFAPDSGKSITLTGAIADMTGSHDHTGQTGTGSLVLDGAGKLVLSGNNTFTGGVTIDQGWLDIASVNGAGTGDIRFAPGAAATLEIPSHLGGISVDGFDATDKIVIDTFQVIGEAYDSGTLTLVQRNGILVFLNFKYPAATLLSDFDVSVDTVNHTTTITLNNVATAWSSGTGGDWGVAGEDSANWTPGFVPTAADDVTIAPNATADFTVSIANGASAYAHNLTLNDAHATIDDIGSLALSGGLALSAGTFHLDGGSLQTVTAIDVANGATFNGYGTVSAASGSLAVSGTVTASDTSHALDFASAVTGTGAFDVAAGATLEFGGSVAGGTTVTFDGGTGELKLDNPGAFNGTIVGFHGTAPDAADSDVIDLAGIDYNSGHFTQTYAGGVLNVSDGTHSAHLAFSNFTDTFVFNTDGHGGTLVFDPPAATPNAATELGSNFAFLPSLGAGATTILDSSHDTFGLAPTVEQLNSLSTADSHTAAAIDLGHDAAVPIMSSQQVQAVLNAVHLH